MLPAKLAVLDTYEILPLLAYLMSSNTIPFPTEISLKHMRICKIL